MPSTASAPDWARHPGLQPLWRAAFDALARNGRRLPRTFTVRGLDNLGRRETGALTGRILLDANVRIDATDLDSRLVARCGLGLLAVLDEILGPVPDLPGVAAAADAARTGPVADACARAERSGVTGEWVQDWARSVLAAGLVVRGGLTGDDLLTVLTVAAHLPGPTPVSRVQLAATRFGDAHALDAGTAKESVLLRAIAARTGAPLPGSADGRRVLWEAAGVAPDLVSSTCLMLGIDTGGDSAAAQRIRLAPGDPVHVTGWDLARLPPVWPSTRGVFVCENPRVLEAVAQRFAGTVPAVCVSGQPGLVSLDVLRRLWAGGSTLRYHGDSTGRAWRSPTGLSMWSGQRPGGCPPPTTWPEPAGAEPSWRVSLCPRSGMPGFPTP